MSNTQEKQLPEIKRNVHIMLSGQEAIADLQIVPHDDPQIHKIIAIKPITSSMGFYHAKRWLKERFSAKDCEILYWLGGSGQESWQGFHRLCDPNHRISIPDYEGDLSGFQFLVRESAKQFRDAWFITEAIKKFRPHVRFLSYAEVAKKFAQYDVTSEQEIEDLLEYELRFDSVKLLTENGERVDGGLGRREMMHLAENDEALKHEDNYQAMTDLKRLYYGNIEIDGIIDRRLKTEAEIQFFVSKESADGDIEIYGHSAKGTKGLYYVRPNSEVVSWDQAEVILRQRFPDSSLKEREFWLSGNPEDVLAHFMYENPNTMIDLPYHIAGQYWEEPFFRASLNKHASSSRWREVYYNKKCLESYEPKRFFSREKALSVIGDSNLLDAKTQEGKINAYCLFEFMVDEKIPSYTYERANASNFYQLPDSENWLYRAEDVQVFSRVLNDAEATNISGVTRASKLKEVKEWFNSLVSDSNGQQKGVKNGYYLELYREKFPNSKMYSDNLFRDAWKACVPDEWKYGNAKKKAGRVRESK